MLLNLKDALLNITSKLYSIWKIDELSVLCFLKFLLLGKAKKKKEK